MRLDLQLLATLTCVALAAAWLGWRAWRLWRGRSMSGCGSCAQCPTATNPSPAGFVSLDTLQRTLPPR